MYKKIVLLFCLFISMSSVFASQNNARDPEKISFANNQTVYTKLSLDEANRVFIKNDKIKKIVFSDGGAGVATQQPNGESIITLGMSAKKNNPVMMYIYTVNGRALSIVAQPVHDIGITIELDPLDGPPKDPKKSLSKDDYRDLMAKIIKSMILYPKKKELLDGFSPVVIPKSATDQDANKNDLLVYPVLAFRGYDYVGIQYAIKNTTNKKIRLTPQQFYRKGVLAGALSKGVVKPQEIIYSYQVTAK